MMKWHLDIFQGIEAFITSYNIPALHQTHTHRQAYGVIRLKVHRYNKSWRTTGTGYRLLWSEVRERQSDSQRCGETWIHADPHATLSSRWGPPVVCQGFDDIFYRFCSLIKVNVWYNSRCHPIFLVVMRCARVVCVEQTELCGFYDLRWVAGKSSNLLFWLIHAGLDWG